MAYNDYLLKHSAQTKVMDKSAQEANRLVKTMMHGLRDRFVVCHILHSGLYTACVADPTVFIMNHLATRPQVWTLWAVIAGVALDLTEDAEGGANKWKKINRNAENIFKDRVLELHPEWKDQYDEWEVRTERVPLVQRFMAMCRDPSRCSIIAEFAVAAGARAHAKIMEHRGKDCGGISELQHAPVNTDTTESGIGALDHNLYRCDPELLSCIIPRLPLLNLLAPSFPSETKGLYAIFTPASG